MGPGIYAATLLKNKAISEKQLCEAQDQQFLLAKEELPAKTLGSILKDKDLLSESLNLKLTALLTDYFGKIHEPIPDEDGRRLMHKAFVETATQHNILSCQQIDELEEIMTSTATSIDISLIALHCGYLERRTVIGMERHIIEKVLADSTEIKELHTMHKAIADDFDHEVATKEKEDTCLKTFVRHIAKSTQHIELLLRIEQVKMEVFDCQSLAERTGIKKKIVNSIFNDWEHHGLIKKIQGKTFNYSPNEDDRNDIIAFFEKWRDPDGHRTILKHVLSQESD